MADGEVSDFVAEVAGGAFHGWQRDEAGGTPHFARGIGGEVGCPPANDGREAFRLLWGTISGEQREPFPLKPSSESLTRLRGDLVRSNKLPGLRGRRALICESRVDRHGRFTRITAVYAPSIIQILHTAAFFLFARSLEQAFLSLGSVQSGEPAAVDQLMCVLTG